MVGSVSDEAVSAPTDPMTEQERVSASPRDLDPWRHWGPYVSGRQWGTVREDYSAGGDAWDDFPFEQAHTRAYRWGEDGLAGICDRWGFLNLAIAVWNGRDDRLKERYFGLTNGQGNHGEDVKEYWWHVDATPTHSYAQWLYRYPQAAFPYAALRAENARRGKADPEFELSDTGILADNRFFDVTVTHAKASPDDVVMVVTATNHGPDAAPLDLLPHLWFRNTWSWGRDDRRPTLRVLDAGAGRRAIAADHGALGRYVLTADGEPRVLLCDNETNTRASFGTDDGNAAHPKDAINAAVVHGDESLLTPDGGVGTKAAFWWHFDAVGPGQTVTVRVRLASDNAPAAERAGGVSAFDDVDGLLAGRLAEADAFYTEVLPSGTSAEDAVVARRAFAGLLWSKQLYRYDIRQWLAGDPGQPVPPASRHTGRNSSWTAFSLADVISMPDEWEYPWFATWDLAFHCVTMAHVDPAFAKAQLVLMCREWAMAPNGQLPAYEWDFGDVNPPVHAWAAWRVYELDGGWDRAFLVRVMSKLLFNFGWWVNRKDANDTDLFEGGFLGMDNIGPFDRSAPLPGGAHLEQSDATGWMAFYCLSMLRIALELAREDVAWDDVATKFLEHFLMIAEAMERFGSQGVSLWDEQDGFYYDVVVTADGSAQPVRVRSMVGLLPILGVAHSPGWVPRALPDFTSRMGWLRRRRPELLDAVVQTHAAGHDETTLSVLSTERLSRILTVVLDERQFLSPYGVRSLSAAYRDGSTVNVAGVDLAFRYTPAESDSGLFGGNSNWRGPVWFPVNVLLSDALRLYAGGCAADLTLELPTGSGHTVSLADVADDLDERLISLFRPGPGGRRPGDPVHVPTGDLWAQHPTFSEYFNGDTGAGLGASHQTGWTAMVAHLICSRRTNTHD